MKVLTIYISGPISGLPDGNRPAFAEMAARLRADGHTVVNPHELFREVAQPLTCGGLVMAMLTTMAMLTMAVRHLC